MIHTQARTHTYFHACSERVRELSTDNESDQWRRVHWDL